MEEGFVITWIGVLILWVVLIAVDIYLNLR